jgi:DNA-binding NtrC family response regulator
MNFTRDVSSGKEGFHWLGRILEIDPGAVVILITAFGDVDMAVRAMKAGATDFVVKPWQNEKLIATVSSALALSRSRREVLDLRSRQERLNADLDRPFQDFIGHCDGIRDVREIVEKVAATEADVLITGEHGTGKELVARAVHRRSRRARGVFVSVDMGALSGTLFESELFGHVKGAFTDAKDDRPGRFELAAGGTLLLDEIGNLPPDLQAKLLTVLQSRKLTRVGSSTPIEVDFRLICATNMILPEMVERGEFREDLFYRINTIEIPLPPLRERGDDIPLLVHHFLERYARKYRKNVRGIGAQAMSRLRSYHWPGNVRELQHSVERAVIMSSSATLGPRDFLLPSPGKKRNLLPLDTFNLEEVEEVVIRNAMARFDGNVSRVARELGLSRPALYRKLSRYGV